MTEIQIETTVQKLTDSLERRFMNGRLCQAEYDRKLKAIDRWAEMRLRWARA